MQDMCSACDQGHPSHTQGRRRILNHLILLYTVTVRFGLYPLQGCKHNLLSCCAQDASCRLAGCLHGHRHFSHHRRAFFSSGLFVIPACS